MTFKTKIAIVVLCALYLLLMLWTPFRFDWFFKIAPLLIVLYQAVIHLTGKVRNLAVVALIFSMMGDVILTLDIFIAGLVAFLVAQVIYIVIFFGRHQSFAHRSWLSIPLIGYMLFMAWFLFPSLGEMAAPVMVYLVAIGVMGLSAITSQYPGRWLVAGTLIFIVSDTLIAISQFISPVPAGEWWVMITYYLAQFAIINSLIQYHKIQD